MWWEMNFKTGLSIGEYICECPINESDFRHVTNRWPSMQNTEPIKIIPTYISL